MKNIIHGSLKIGGVIIEDKKSLLKKEISQVPNGIKLTIGTTKDGCSFSRVINKHSRYQRIGFQDKLQTFLLL
ncbi:hypothetical protein ACOL3H_07225 [Aliarcobacter butzleri]